jgi:enolase
MHPFVDGYPNFSNTQGNDIYVANPTRLQKGIEMR